VDLTMAGSANQDQVVEIVSPSARPTLNVVRISPVICASWQLGLADSAISEDQQVLDVFLNDVARALHSEHHRS